MAFILVQHLDPNHPSMMVDLLASHTAMVVLQAAEGMRIEPDHLYVIPPAKQLSIEGGALRLSQPAQAHGARMPFDFLLRSMAGSFGNRAIAIVLSGSGWDGSTALLSVKSQLGLVIAQDPSEAASDGMPRSAIEAGVVDLVLPAAKIPDAILEFDRQRPRGDGSSSALVAASTVEARLPEIIALLRERTSHDFTLYKPGTLQRRTERRMAMVGKGDVDGYIALLKSDASEAERLAADLLINVTRFFRDPEIFDFLAETVIPDLVARRAADRKLRIWIAGCSTGEEAYSLVILILEHIARVGGGINLQVFASDADLDAVAIAREGQYSDSVAADISPERLARYFSKEKHGYRVLPELRSAVIFTCQDVLIDPPFSRLDFISCRNLLIYLGATAQTRVIDLFHFALREGGILLLGNTESIGATDGRFEALSEAGRVYRHVVRCRPGEVRFSMGVDDGVRCERLVQPEKPRLRPSELAELCRRMVIEHFAPAAILINSRIECLYSVGPIERYLHVSPGHPTHDLLDMAPQAMRTRLRAVIAEAREAKARARAAGFRVNLNGVETEFDVDVIPVPNGSEHHLLVCFVEASRKRERKQAADAGETLQNLSESTRDAALEIELEAIRSELRHTIYDLEQSREEQKAISEEASSVAEEYQSTNEELLTSKEELQSLNEELTALNGQLHETLERQQTTSDYLQNILYSTDVATLFLDADLRIRFFTPATKQLFNVIPSDIGRPLGDLSSLSADRAALEDSRTVLRTFAPIEREIETQQGVWFMRRILPYRTHDDGIEGVVITFTDISERKRTAEALLSATQQAQTANAAKSRFLAVASHDLRQPLQSLVLIQGLLAKQISGDKPRKLLARLDETLSAMSGMLNTLLDINQIEVGAVEPNVVNFPINDLLARLRDEFAYHAQARGLLLRVVPSSLMITTDPRLLEQMLRNLLSNAVKYTERGKVLLGCRRRAGVLSIEVWDTGIGIPKTEFKSIFDEYYQLGNPARQRSQGLGLGLSIVQRLANLLGHRIDVRSRPGKGSGFAVEIKHRMDHLGNGGPLPHSAGADEANLAHRTGSILVVEDDPEVRDLLEDFLVDEGHQAVTASDGAEVELLLSRAAVRPSLMIADYNLPNGMSGIELTSRVRARLSQDIPVIILTGDISTEALRHIGQHACVHLNKPVRIEDLAQAIQRLLPHTRAAVPRDLPQPSGAPQPAEPSIVYVVDDDGRVREEVRAVLEAEGWTVADFATSEAFLSAFRPGGAGCLLIDAHLPSMGGIETLQKLRTARQQLPTIIMTGSSDVGVAVEAMKSGAMDFIEKPVARSELLAAISHALELSRDRNKLVAWQTAAASQLADLTLRQRQIMDLVLAGHPSKNIAADLGISQRTVENHRAAIMLRTGAKSLPELARLAVAAASNETMDGAGENVIDGRA